MASIIPYIQMAGGQTVVVPDGTYTGGTITSGGTHSDWLVLVATTRNGVIIDDTAAGLIMNPVTKVVFVGFKFDTTHVSVRNLSADVVFWYPEMQYPIEAWSAGGFDPNPLRLIATSGGGGKPQRCRVYGGNIHNVGDDGIQFNADDTEILGTKIFDVTSKGNSQFHNDVVQVLGGARTIINYCDLAGHVQAGEDAGSITQLDILNSWLHGSNNYGIIYNWKTGFATLTGTRQRLYSWDNGLGDRRDYVNASSGAPGWDPAHVNVVDTAVTVAAPPAGTANPADLWQSANPYSSWPSFLNLNLPPPPPPPPPADSWYIDDAVNAGSSASATVTIPATAVEGDLCDITLQIPASLTASLPTSAGGLWTQAVTDVSAVVDVDHSRHYRFYRVLTADAEASDVVTITLSGSSLWDVGMIVLRGVSVQHTVNVADTQVTGFGNTGNAPDVTTTADECFVVVSLAGVTDNAAASDWTEPAGTTERIDNGASNRSLAVSAHVQSARGATGSFTATCLHNGYPIGSTVAYAPLAVDLPSGGGGDGGTPSGCTTFFPFFPLVLCASEIFSIASVDNDGQGLAWPVWVIYGPGSDLVLTNLTTNETLSIRLTLTSTGFVIIDTRPGVKTITDGAGNNLLGDSTGSLWALARGVNDLDIKLTGATVESSVQLTYRRRWLSP